MDSIIKGYLFKFKDVLGAEDVDLIFGNIQELHQLHCDFLEKVRPSAWQRPAPGSSSRRFPPVQLQTYTSTKPLLLGQVFMEMGGRFMLYEPYYINHPGAMTLLQVRTETGD